MLFLSVYYGIILSSVNICSFSLGFWQFLTVFSVSHCVFSFYVASDVTVTTVTKVTTVSTVNFICILWHYFCLIKYLQFLTQFLAVSHCIFSFSLNFQFLIVFSVFYVACGVTVTTVTKVTTISTTILSVYYCIILS